MIILIIISNFFYSIFNFQVTYSFAHVKPSKRFISLFFALLCFFHNVFCNVRNQCLLNVLFLILDEPYLTRFGIFWILCLLVFLSTGLIALECMLIPKFAKASQSFVSLVFNHVIFYIHFLILLTLSCIGAFARANLTFFIFDLVFVFFHGPIVLVLDTLMLPGRYFLLILLYLDTKEVPFGRFTLNRTAHLLRTFFSSLSSSYSSSFSTTKILFNKGFAILLMNGAAADAKNLNGNPFPLCFLYRLFFAQCTKHLFFIDCFPPNIINHHLFDLLCMFYVLKSVCSSLKYRDIHPRSDPKLSALFFWLQLVLKEFGD